MIRISKHINLLRVFFAVLFIFGSSGFGMALNRCAMGNMDCCIMPLQNGHDNCDDSSSKQADLSFKTDFVCHISTFVGGLKTSSGLLLENDQLNTKIESISIPSVANFMEHVVRPISTTLLTFEPPSPSARAKYVLFDSFLI
jgi:hypothetical protein